MDGVTFEAVVGGNVARLRAAAGRTQAMLADDLGLRGITWRRSTVAQVETGRRSVSLAEAIALADALGVPLAELLRSEAPVDVDGGTWHPSYVVAAVAGTARDLSVIESYTSPRLEAERRTLDHVLRWGLGAVRSMEQTHAARWPRRRHESDVEAAGPLEEGTARRLEGSLRLGVGPWDVVAAAQTLWGRSLLEEREARVQERAGAGANERTLQAVRGLVMRRLDKELTEAIQKAADRAAATALVEKETRK